MGFVLVVVGDGFLDGPCCCGAGVGVQVHGGGDEMRGAEDGPCVRG